MSAAILERRHFTVTRANEYFTPDGLQKETGQPPNQFRQMALKELLDNALDAAETASNAPEVQVEFVETDNGLTLTIADNGRGIPAQVVERIIGDFSASTSDKACYRSPMRGAQGNALKTVIGMPVALGADRSRLAIAADGVQHDIEVWVSPAGDIRHIHHQSPAETQGTRITVMIPGSPECYYWHPARWIFAYALFNPHAQLQIRKIAPFWESQDENNESKHAFPLFSDLSLTPTVTFPDSRWRKFLPTDPTPAHWYTDDEFARLIHRIAAQAPDQPVGDLIQEFKGTSRNWRTIQKSVSAKTVAELADSAGAIAALHSALLTINPAPKPEVLGRVGPDHFRQRIDERFQIVGSRYWYKHQWAIAEGMPYLIEVAIAETEKPGDVFYGLNYSVPFSDPLSTTALIYDGGQERLENNGLTAFLKDAGVFNGSRYGRTINTAAAIHLVMPLLPTLDRGKSRLEISADLASAIAATIGVAAKTLHKEIVDARRHQKKREQQQRSIMVNDWRSQHKERERQQRELLAEQSKEEREQRRQARQIEQAEQAEQRRLRGELPTKQDVVFELMLPTYLDITEQETIRIAQRDFWYVLNPLYKKREVRPSDKDDPESAILDYGHFSRLVANYRSQHHPMSMIDYKARATLYEGHSKREIAFGDRELRTYTLPPHEYAGILFIEKQCVWPSLKDTGIAELAHRHDLLIIISEGYATEAVRRLLAQAQQAGLKIMAWHDADPAGYNIIRVLGAPTDRMPDHHLDIIDLGLTIEEGLREGLQTETFTRKKAFPEGILSGLNEKELELFTGSYDKDAGCWRGCQRIEINAIKIRDRVPYLEKKIAAIFQAKPTKPGEAPTPTARPPIETIRATTTATIDRVINDHIRAAIAERINVDNIAALARKQVTTLPIMDEGLQAALDTDPAANWRDVVRQYANEAIDEQQASNITHAVISAIWESLKGMPRDMEAAQ